MEPNELNIRNQTKESQLTQQLANSNKNTNTIRRSQSDRRTLHLKTSTNEDALISSRTKLTNSKIKKRFKTQQKTTDNKTIDINLQNRSPLNQRFQQDHYNTESLAGLLDFNTKQDKSKIKTQKQQQKLNTSKKKQSNIKINLSDQDDNSDQQFSSANIQRQTSSKQITQSFSTYTQGQQLLTKQSIKKLNQPFKIKAYSVTKDLQNIKDRKYVIKNQNQKRMQDKYWKGQQRFAQQIRTIKQFTKIMKNYQLSKKRVIQESSKKHQMKKIFAERFVQKSYSLPKLKTNQNLQPNNHTQQPKSKQKIQKNNQNTLSSSKYEVIKKKKKKMKTCSGKDPIEEQRQNAQQLQRVLKSKGIKVQEGAIKKGLVNLRTLPDYTTDQFPSKDLFSNYIYQKYPL